MPRGIHSLLREVAEGEELTEKRIQQALSDFNDREWKVESALQHIDFYALRRELGLSLLTINVLGELRYGKINLRRAVQAEVNPYGQDGIKPNRARAKKLIAAIEKLNTEIEDIEGIVNARARSGPVRKTAAKKKTPAKKKATTKKRRGAANRRESKR